MILSYFSRISVSSFRLRSPEALQITERRQNIYHTPTIRIKKLAAALSVVAVSVYCSETKERVF